MVVNLDILSLFFNQCNYMYFDNELPVPEFGILHSFRTCGFFQYIKGGWFDKTLYDPILSMTDYYDFTEEQFVDIMCHEMVHYYLAYIGEDRDCSHGKKFKKMADQLNRTFGLHITPHLDLSKYKRRKGTPSLSYWFVKQLYV